MSFGQLRLFKSILRKRRIDRDRCLNWMTGRWLDRRHSSLHSSKQSMNIRCLLAIDFFYLIKKQHDRDDHSRQIVSKSLKHLRRLSPVRWVNVKTMIHGWHFELFSSSSSVQLEEKEKENPSVMEWHDHWYSQMYSLVLHRQGDEHRLLSLDATEGETPDSLVRRCNWSSMMWKLTWRWKMKCDRSSATDDTSISQCFTQWTFTRIWSQTMNNIPHCHQMNRSSFLFFSRSTSHSTRWTRIYYRTLFNLFFSIQSDRRLRTSAIRQKSRTWFLSLIKHFFNGNKKLCWSQ